ncbi:MAG: RNA polymerase sigma factor RpoE [Porticoccaceae bacterium]|nr:RNA polymerase sigma factor RpoE [Porticoccaceae bacterium]|tara:strand:+ start:65 stop:658 length:594 start_codon:yes stop_codon:yes gene_type:complete
MIDQTTSNVTDCQLLSRVKKGDKRAFELIVIKYQQKVQNSLTRFIKDQDELNDLTQEVFIKVYKAISAFRGDSQFYTWLHRIALNTAKNHLVAKSRRPPTSDIQVSDAENYKSFYQLHNIDTPENILFCEQLDQILKETVRQLPEDLRCVISLRENKDLSYEEIAKIMGCPTGTVRSRLFRAREILDEKIKTLLNDR